MNCINYQVEFKLLLLTFYSFDSLLYVFPTRAITVPTPSLGINRRRDELTSFWWKQVITAMST